MTSFENHCEGSEERFISNSILPLPPCLKNFPFSDLYPALDMYSIFHLEPMHNLSLGVSRMLILSVVNYLKDTDRKTTSIRTKGGDPRKYSSVCNTILMILNRFLSEVQTISVSYELKVDLSSSIGHGELSGLFHSDGLCGTLEITHFDIIDEVSPFIGSIVDRCCENNETAEVTKLFTKYFDLVNMEDRRNMAPIWKSRDLSELNRNVKYVKLCAQETFENYQKSKICTNKFHIIDHLVTDMKRTGGLTYM